MATDGIILIIVFISGGVFGAALVRYGLGLGAKLYYSAREEIPFLQTEQPMEQETTGE